MSKQSKAETLELVRGEVLIGTIEVKPEAADPPWHSGKFTPTKEYEDVRSLFEKELRMLRANTTNNSAQWDTWETVHAELHDPGMRLQSPDRSFESDEFLIHIDGAEAWWRLE